MSRIGRKPVPVPPSVKVSIAEKTIEIEGPKGKLSFTHRPEIEVAFDKAAGQILVQAVTTTSEPTARCTDLPAAWLPTWCRASRLVIPRSSRSSVSATRPN